MRRVLPAVWLTVLLSLPAALWLLGDRQPLLESRAKEPFPPINRSSVRDENTFRRIDTALLDRFPGRERALDLHARIAIELFRDSPNPDVAIGSGGWFYYVPELGPCRPGGEPIGDAADAAEALARTLVASGKRTVVTLAPSKLFVHTADAPTIDTAQERCADDLERRVEQRLTQTPGGLALGPALRRLEAAGKPTYLRTDTHWNWRGRELFARLVLDRIRPGLARESGLRARRNVTRDTDLSIMVGRRRSDDDRVVEAMRTPPRPFAAGDVVMVGDSQLDLTFRVSLSGASRPISEVVLPGAVHCDWLALVEGRCDDPIRAARAVVIEKVARDAQFFTSACWRPIALVGESLSGPAARWERVDGGPDAPGGRSLTIPESGTATVRVRIPEADRSQSARLLRLPLTANPAGPDGAVQPLRLTQEPQAGPPAPCAMPEQAVVGGSLFLPVPADRRASDLVIRLEGTPGARLGAPRVVDLATAARPAGVAWRSPRRR